MESFKTAIRSRYSHTIEQRTTRLDPDVRRQLAEEIESKLKIRSSDEEAKAEEVSAEYVATAVAPATDASSVSSERNNAGADDNDNFDQEEDETDIAIAELDISLKESRAGLAKSEEAERFLGTRVAKYRTMLYARSKNLDRMDAACALRGEKESLLVEKSGKSDVEEGGALPTKEELCTMRAKHLKNEEALDKVVGMHKGILADVERMRRKIHDLESKREDIIERREECRDFLIAAFHAEDAEAAGKSVAGAGSCPLALPTGGKDCAGEEKTG